MEIEKKRTIFFGSLLALAVVGSVVFFFWGNLINKGTIKLIGDAPFKVEIYGLSRQECPTSPCLVKTKSGYKDLLISKDGFRSIITSTTVKLWRTVELPLVFDIVPHVEAADAIPEIQKKIEFDMVLDRGNNMQKLINKSNVSSESLAYFPKPISKFKIIGDKNAALILDLNSQNNSGYIVNFETKKREEVSQKDLFYVEDGRWSNDGKFLIFRKKNSEKLWELNVSNKNISQLQLATGIKQISWSYDDNLVFVTDQSYSTVGENEINLLDTKSQTGVTFGIYKANSGKSELLGAFSQILSLPDEFIATSNGNTIYFKSDKKNFKIILRKI
ncbi:MAG: hypothetical protein NTZ25_01645 [Candidatus Peregrinibacteria bacterium]|nr:hypothetical protein [Candidatus Peregrinibacteria bacterium]